MQSTQAVSSSWRMKYISHQQRQEDNLHMETMFRNRNNTSINQLQAHHNHNNSNKVRSRAKHNKQGITVMWMHRSNEIVLYQRHQHKPNSITKLELLNQMLQSSRHSMLSNNTNNEHVFFDILLSSLPITLSLSLSLMNRLIICFFEMFFESFFGFQTKNGFTIFARHWIE